MGRTTGSETTVLEPDGRVVPFVRKRSARITEMIPFVRQCSRANVRCLVVECMALGAENQKTIARMLIRPTHVIITNSYIDHIVEMGPTTEETVWTLAQSVPKGCELFAIEEYYSNLECTFHKVEVKEYSIHDSLVPVHDSNISLAVALCKTLGVSEDDVLASVDKVVPDVGLHKEFLGNNGALFYPDFSVNDLQCMQEAILTRCSDQKKLFLIYNNRADREYRLQLMVQILKKHGNRVAGIFCIGDYPKKVASYFSRKCGASTIVSSEQNLFARINEMDGSNVFLGIGNIKGAGECLINLFLQKEEE